jgi:hypothetical protein
MVKSMGENPKIMEIKPTIMKKSAVTRAPDALS